MTRKEILNTPEIVDFMIDKSVMVESKMKLHKRLDELCKLAIEALDQEPCEDCISREHLLKEIASLKESPWFKDDTNCAMAIKKEAIEIVEDLCIRKEPSVNPQKSKIGYWKPFDLTFGRNYYYCTYCEYAINMETVFKYCPHCGARMEG